MNKERLLEIAEWLESGAEPKCGVIEFDMSTFGSVLKRTPIRRHICGTAACIAGTAVMWEHGPSKGMKLIFDTSRTRAEHPGFTEGKKLLDLTHEQATKLFLAIRRSGAHIYFAHIGPRWAARCIRKLVETGEVDWDGTEYEQEKAA